jgi:hypothetical protein
MVTNSFGKRNFMQPMGRRAQACTQGALHFFLLSLGVWGWGGFFPILPWFSMCSHHVPNEFSSGFQYVPQVPNVFPNMFSIAPHFYPICFAKCCAPFTYIAGPNGRNFLLWGVSIVLFWCSLQKQKIECGRQLI